MSKNEDKYYSAVKNFYNLKKRYDKQLEDKKHKIKKLSTQPPMRCEDTTKLRRLTENIRKIPITPIFSI